MRYPPVGKCIYCYRTADEADSRLTAEHIVAESLNGRDILPEASCDDCQKLTSKFELIFARTMYGGLRARRGFRSKRSSKKRHSTRVNLYKDGQRFEQIIPFDQLPGHFLAAELPPPGILEGRAPSDRNPEFKIHVKGFAEEKLSGFDNAEAASIIHKFDWNAFNRTIAKTAHAYLVSQLGTEGYEPFLPDIVRGQSGIFSHFIGGLRHLEVPSPEELELFYLDDKLNRLILIHVRLMGGDRLPTYLVVAGRVTDHNLIQSRKLNLHV